MCIQVNDNEKDFIMYGLEGKAKGDYAMCELSIHDCGNHLQILKLNQRFECITSNVCIINQEIVKRPSDRSKTILLRMRHKRTRGHCESSLYP